MSKYVKNLITEHLRQRLEGVRDALLVDMIGLKANTAHRLRTELRSKNINVMVVKNSLARRAVAGTPLAGLFDSLDGPAAICWGGEDVVTLAKEVVRCAKDEQYAPFRLRRGVMDGQPLGPEQLEDLSRWPSRTELLAILLGQLLSPPCRIAGQLTAPGAAISSQMQQAAEQRHPSAHSELEQTAEQTSDQTQSSPSQAEQAPADPAAPT